jgi:hypothetical protein
LFNGLFPIKKGKSKIMRNHKKKKEGIKINFSKIIDQIYQENFDQIYQKMKWYKEDKAPWMHRLDQWLDQL